MLIEWLQFIYDIYLKLEEVLNYWKISSLWWWTIWSIQFPTLENFNRLFTGGTKVEANGLVLLLELVVAGLVLAIAVGIITINNYYDVMDMN